MKLMSFISCLIGGVLAGQGLRKLADDPGLTGSLMLILGVAFVVIGIRFLARSH